VVELSSDQISSNFIQISNISASPPTYFFNFAAASFNALASAFCFSLNALSSSSSTFSAPFACFNGFTLPPSSQSAVCKNSNSKGCNKAKEVDDQKYLNNMSERETRVVKDRTVGRMDDMKEIDEMVKLEGKKKRISNFNINPL